MKTTTQKLVISAMFAALTCVATMVITIPSPLKGYLNLGDCVVLLSAWILSPGYAFLAAGIGSGLADLFSGYAVYSPATFVIKGLMTVVAIGVFRLISGKLRDIPSRIISGIAAEGVMVLGYFLFEGILYSFEPSLVNIPANAVQGAAGVIFGVILIKIFERHDLHKFFK